MCRICDEKHYQEMLDDLASSRLKTILNNAQRLNIRDMVIGAYKKGVTDMALTIIDNKNKISELDYQI